MIPDPDKSPFYTFNFRTLHQPPTISISLITLLDKSFLLRGRFLLNFQLVTPETIKLHEVGHVYGLDRSEVILPLLRT